MVRFTHLLASIALCAAAACGDVGHSNHNIFGQELAMTGTEARVTINGRTMTGPDLASMGVRPESVPPGDYWYDGRAGLWGRVGGGAQGIVPAGYQLGELRRDVSGGRTGVLVNGREITHPELAYLQQLAGGAIPPGRYFLNANGDAGVEGGPVIGNLRRAAGGARYIGSNGTLSSTGGFYDPSTGDHFVTVRDNITGKTISSGI